MSFDSVHFFLFFGAVVLFVRLLRQRVALRNLFLLGASYYFYACWDWRFLGLIFLSTAVDYVCGRVMSVTDDDLHRRLPARKRDRAAVTVSIAANLAVLGFFKYFNFFIDSAALFLEAFGFESHLPTLRIILPVGVSFYTFQTLSYTIDLYRRRLPTERNPITFALFVAFFPQLVAGPIERAKHLLPQLSSVRPVTVTDLYSGAYLIFWGLFKKVVIADNVALFANIGFAEASTSGLAALLSVYAFTIQIYCDFSGYSDIARGAARMLGFDLMLNFNLPYFAVNPRDFWRRWHISLSSWLRDYLYISLGGNRRGPVRHYFNLMATMVLGGLWHGAAWTFVAWGTYHGLLLCLHRALEPFLERIPRLFPSPWGRVWSALRWIVFLHLVCFGWLLFRAESLGQAGRMAATVFTDFFGAVPTAFTVDHGLLLAGCGLILIAVQAAQYLSGDLNVLFRLPLPLRGLLWAAALIGLVIFGNFTGSEFIYFQF